MNELDLIMKIWVQDTQNHKTTRKDFHFISYKAMIQSNDSYIHQYATNDQKWNNLKWYINVEQLVFIS